MVGAVASKLAHGGNPFVYPGARIALDHGPREAISMLVGAVFAAIVIVTSRVGVTRWSWAKRLHQDLRPIAIELSTPWIVALAAISAIGEELLFRSLLVPWIGAVPQAIVFGLLHQVRGPSRWVWITWATVAGLFFGGLYELLGTLSGPVLAHGLINGVNLHFLKRFNPDNTE